MRSFFKENWFKLSIVAVLILGLVFGISTYLDFQQKSEMTESNVLTERQFEKKQECESHRPGLESELKDKGYMGQNISVFNYLDEIWFSPSLNTCLYSSKQLISDSKKNMSTIEFSIHDLLANRKLYYSGGVLNEESGTIAESEFKAEKARLRE